jgi:universal stress protein E
MHRYQKILVGVDFSPASRAAIKAAMRFSSYHGGNIVAFHVADASSARGTKGKRKLSAADHLEALKGPLADFIAESVVGTCCLNLLVEIGKPAECIKSACDRLGVDLLVLGNNGMEHQPRPLGTVAGELARNASVDVLLVREGQDRVFDHVLACVDFSQESMLALQDARQIAKHEGADLDCLYVYQSAVACALPYDRHLPLPTFVASTETVEGWKRELENFVHSSAPEMERPAPKAIVLEHHSVPAGICDYVQHQKVNLVVLGRSRKMALRKIAMGTAAEEIIRHADCAVLVVSPERPKARHGSMERSLPNSLISQKSEGNESKTASQAA